MYRREEDEKDQENGGTNATYVYTESEWTDSDSANLQYDLSNLVAMDFSENDYYWHDKKLRETESWVRKMRGMERKYKKLRNIRITSKAYHCQIIQVT